MHVLIRQFFLGGAVLLPVASPLTAASQTVQDGPPHVLVIQREFLKPGKGGMLHERSEAAFVQAYAAGEPNLHYVAMDALSGPSRSLFLSSYDSLAAWEKAQAAVNANPTKAAAVDQATLADGDLLSAYDSAAMIYRPDLSFNQGHMKGTRFFEIITFVVKPGHRHDFAELAHLYAEAYRKATPDDHWDTFEIVYGNPAPGIPAGSAYLVMHLVHSMAQVDAAFQATDKISSAMGADGMKRAEALTAASIEAQSTNVFALNPRMSNPAPEFVAMDPDFWKAPSASGGNKSATK